LARQAPICIRHERRVRLLLARDEADRRDAREPVVDRMDVRAGNAVNAFHAFLAQGFCDSLAGVHWGAGRHSAEASRVMNVSPPRILSRAPLSKAGIQYMLPSPVRPKTRVVLSALNASAMRSRTFMASPISLRRPPPEDRGGAMHRLCFCGDQSP